MASSSSSSSFGAAPPTSPRYAARPTVLASEIAVLERDPASVTVSQLLNVAHRMAADVAALSQVMVRVKTSSGAFDRRAEMLEGVESRVADMCSALQKQIGSGLDDNLSHEIKQLQSRSGDLELLAKKLIHAVDVSLPGQLSMGYEELKGRSESSDGQIVECKNLIAKCMEALAAVEPRVAAATESVAQTEGHMKWYKTQFEDTEARMADFINNMPTVAAMNKRMEGYIATVSRLTDLLGDIQRDTRDEFERRSTESSKQVQGARDEAYNAHHDLVDRVKSLETKLQELFADRIDTERHLRRLSDIVDPAPAAVVKPAPLETEAVAKPEPGREYVYVCERVLGERIIYGLGNPQLADEREMTWSGIVDQVPELQSLEMVYPKKTPFIDLVAAYRKVIPDMDFRSVVVKFARDAKAKKICEIPPLATAVFATLLLIKFMNQNGHAVVPATRVQQLVCQIESKGKIQGGSV